MKRHPSPIPLSYDHQHGLALAVLIDRESESQSVLAKRVTESWRAELENHFRVEEEFAFPAVRGRTDPPDLVDDLVAQHRELESLVQQVETAQGVALGAALQQFGRRLSEHIRQEEREVFERIQALLEEVEIAELREVITRECRRPCPTP